MVQLAARQILALEIEVRVLVGEPFSFVTQVLLVGLLFPCIVLADTGVNWGSGPIEVRDTHPLALFHSSFSAKSPAVLNPGESQLRAVFSWSNTLNVRSEAYSVDAEVRVGELEFRHSPISNLDFRVSLPLQWRGVGVLDSFLDKWHQAFGLPRGKRDDVPEDRFLIGLENENGNIVRVEHAGTYLGDLEIGAKYLIATGDEQSPAWAVASSLRLPTSTDSYSQDFVDIGLELLGSKSLGEYEMYWGVGYLFFGDDSTRGIEFKQHHVSGFAGGEYQYSETWSFSAVLLANSALLHNALLFPEYSVYLDLGANYLVTRNTAIEFLLRENPSPGEGTTDVAVLVGVKMRFGRSPGT